MISRIYTRYFDGAKQGLMPCLFDSIEMHSAIYLSVSTNEKLSCRTTIFMTECRREIMRLYDLDDIDDTYDILNTEKFETDTGITIIVKKKSNIYKSVRLRKDNAMIDYDYSEAVNPNMGDEDYEEDLFELFQKQLQTMSNIMVSHK